jgi:hypothetical protein
MGDLLPEIQGEERFSEMPGLCTFLARLADGMGAGGAGGRGGGGAGAKYDEVAGSMALFQPSLYGLLFPVQHFYRFFAISSHHYLLVRLEVYESLIF